MQVRLMFGDRAFQRPEQLSFGSQDLLTDLQLEDLLQAMAAGDRLLYTLAKEVLLHPVTDPDTIGYRQQVLTGCLERPDAVASLYDLCSQALQTERSVYIGFLRSNPNGVLHRARTVLSQLAPFLKQLAAFAHRERPLARSTGLAALYDGLTADLDDDFFDACHDHLKRLSFRDGVIIGRHLGFANRGAGDVLHPPERPPLKERIGLASTSALTYQIPARDEFAGEELALIRGRGINQVANATAQAADFLRGFFQALQREIGFYLGCINLHHRLTTLRQPTCLPAVLQPGDDLMFGSGIYDPLRQRHVAAFLVTHNFDLAARLTEQDRALLSLRARRLESGERTFTLLPAEPLPTSFGRDIYDRVGPGMSPDGQIRQTTGVARWP